MSSLFGARVRREKLTMRLHKGQLATMAVLLSLCTALASADSILVPPNAGPFHWTGTRSTPTLGVVSTGGQTGTHGPESWAAPPAGGGFMVHWDISRNGDGNFVYDYWFTKQSGATLDKAVSHFTLQVSNSFTIDQVLPGSSAGNGPIRGPGDWGPSPSNPGIPGTFYGLKFDGSGVGTNQHMILVTTRLPIWGSFYTKDGVTSGVENAAWNSGFTGTGEAFTRPSSSTSDFTGWIPTPDTLNSTPLPVPLPAAAWMGMALMGSVGGVSVLRKRRNLDS